MADYNSSLPVRTEADGDVVSKIAGLTTANIWEINASNEGLVHDQDVKDAVDAVATALAGDISVIGSDFDIRDLTHVSDSVKIGDGTDFLEINTDGSINVNVQSSALSGTEFHKYGTTTAGVPNTPNDVVTHTVTTAKTFILKQWTASASGKFKAELSVNGAIVDTQFNSTATPNVERTIAQPIEVPAGQIVKVIITNRDNANQDLYAFINGNEV